MTLSLRPGCALLLAFILTACGGDTSTGGTDVAATGDAGPESLGISFVAPAEGESVPPNSTLDLFADVRWPGRPSEIRVRWYSDKEGLLGESTPDTGYRAGLRRVALGAGSHRLRAVAQPEAGGDEAFDEMNVVVIGRPGAPQLHIEPRAPGTRDDLVAVIDVPSSVEPAGELSYLYRWARDGAIQEGLNTARVPFSATRKGERWRVLVTPLLGGYEGEGAEASVTVHNSLPSLEEVEIFPTILRTTTELSCRVSGVADLDGDTVTLAYTWLRNETPVEGAESERLASAQTTKGDRIRCLVRPHDGEEEGEALSSPEVRIENSPPELDALHIAPGEGNASTEFNCEAEGLRDDDGDEVALVWSWLVEGEPVAGAESARFTATGLTRGQSLRCALRPDDGEGDARSWQSEAVVLGNNPPTLTTVLLSPLAPTVLDPLRCRALDAQDLDGDELQLSYTWYIDDALVVGASGELFDSGATRGSTPRFRKGQYLSCEVLPFDGYAQGPSVRSKDRALVVNTPPTVPLAEISPDEGDMFTSFRCESRGWEDPDPGDPQSRRYRWLRNGLVVPGESGESYGGTLAPSDLLVCEITPSDGEQDGPVTLSAGVRIANEPPTMDSASLTPESPTREDELLCSPFGWYDLEGASASYRFSWMVNGQILPGANTSRLRDGFVKGDVVLCVVRPFDGFQEGEAVYSNPVSVVNLPPSLGAVQLVPGHGNHRTVFRCEPMDAEDPDGDTLSFSYRWTLAGVAMPDSGPTVSGLVFAGGDLLRCAAAPSDGLAEGAWVQSNVATLFNAPPAVASVRVEPEGATALDALWCVAEGWSDADGDPESYRYQWLVNGQALAGAVTSELAPGAYGKDDEVVCRVTPWDGYVTGNPRNSAPLVVGNLPPSLGRATLVGLWQGDSLTFECRPKDPYDPDGDALWFHYRWFRNGAELPGVETSTLSAAAFGGADTVQCQITPDDGEDEGAPVLSNTLSMANTPPTAEILAPRAGELGSEMYIRFEGLVADAEEAAEELRVTWLSSRDGVLDTSPPDPEGRVGFASNQLSLGFHVITLRAEDSFRARGEDTVSFAVTIRCGETGYALGDTGASWSDGFETGELTRWDFANYKFVGAGQYGYIMSGCDNLTDFAVDPAGAHSGELGLSLTLSSDYMSVAKRFGATLDFQSVYVECWVRLPGNMGVQFGLFVEGVGDLDPNDYPLHHSGGAVLLTGLRNYAYVPPLPTAQSGAAGASETPFPVDTWVRLSLFRDLASGFLAFYRDDVEIISTTVDDTRVPTGFSIGANAQSVSGGVTLHVDDCLYHVTIP